MSVELGGPMQDRPTPSGRPRLLFVPVSGPRGAGEFYRCQIIADGAAARWPQAEIEFVVSRAAGYRDRSRYPVTLLADSPTRVPLTVDRLIAARRPDVVIFDSAGRAAQLGKAQRLGARTVFVSSRPGKRRKGFGWRRMRALDQHWIVQPALLNGRLGLLEQMKLRAWRTRVVQVDAVFPELDPLRSEAVREAYGLPGPFVLACAGGGNQPGPDQPAAEIFAAAAERIAAEANLDCVTIMGTVHRDAANPAPRRIASVTPTEMVDLLSCADLVLTGGGSLLIQAIACRCPTLAVPLADDQRRRIQLCVDRGLTSTCRLDAGAMAAGGLQLLRDAARLAAMRRQIDAAGFANGLARLLDALGELLAR